MLTSIFTALKTQMGSLSTLLSEERRVLVPEWGYAFLVIVCLCGSLIWMTRRRRAAIVASFDPQTLARVFPEWRPFSFVLRATLYTAALGLVCFALARPQWGYESREVKTRGSILMVAVDVSESMLASDVSPNRLAIARRALSDLSRQMTGDRLGLVPFAGVPFLLCPPTEDMDAFRVFLEMLEPALIPIQGTDLAGALDTALAAFDSNDARDTQAILLLSDGEDHSAALTASIDRAVKAGVRVFTIGVGTNAGAPIPAEGGGFKTNDAGEMILSKRGDATLQEIADKTGGVYVQADEGLDLAALYTKTVRPQLRTRDFNSDPSRVWNEMFTWPLFVAVMLFVCVAWRLPFRRAPLGVFWLTCVLVGVSLNLMIAPTAFARDLSHERYNAGNQAYDAKAYDRAISAYTEVLSNPSSNTDLETRAWFNLGNALYRSGKKQEAVESFDKLLSKNPDHRAARFNRDLIQKELDQEKNEQEKNKENKENKESQDTQNQDQQDASGDAKDGASQGEPSDSQAGDQKEDKTGESSGETNPDQGSESGEKSGKSDGQTDDPASDSKSDADRKAGDTQAGQEKSEEAGAQDPNKTGEQPATQENSPTDQGTQAGEQPDQKENQPTDAQAATNGDPQSGEPQTGVPEAGDAEKGNAQAAPDPRARAAERWLQVVPDSGKSIFQGQVRRSLPNRAMPKEDW